MVSRLPHPRPIPDLTGPDDAIGEAPGDQGVTRARITELTEQAQKRTRSSLGYPGNLSTDFRDLAGLLATLHNNVGDPDPDPGTGTGTGGAGSGSGSGAGGTKALEREVIAFFAELTDAPPGGVYGYVTSGGSEANEFGLYTARQVLPRAPVYTTGATHSSVRKAAHRLGMEIVLVAGRDDGTMDPAALRREAVRRDGGAIVVATIGTTATGAYDDVTALRAAAEAAGPVFVHVDAALGGLLAPFLPQPPGWTFAGDLADSIAISGHKFLGVPVPCGVVLARQHLVSAARVEQYIGGLDRTLGCSRSGLAAALMWVALRDLGRDGLRRQVHQCLTVADYAHHRLASLGIGARRAPGSIIVTFDAPPEDVCAWWDLAVEGDTAHLVAMPHVTPEAIDGLYQSLRHDRTSTTDSPTATDGVTGTGGASGTGSGLGAGGAS